MAKKEKKPLAARAALRSAVKSKERAAALADMYREFGYRGPLPSRAATVRTLAAIPGRDVPLTPPALQELRLRFESNPGDVLPLVRKSMGADLSEHDFRLLLAAATQAFEEPAETVRRLRARQMLLGATCAPPAGSIPDFGISVDRCSTKYEGAKDWPGWVFNCGGYWLLQLFGALACHELPRHAGFASGFVYPMLSASGAALGADDTIEVSLFSDFGTGAYQSLYIAEQMRRSAPPHYAIHLGDVYYAGTREEVRDHLKAPLSGLLARSQVFVLNANHEMLSGGFGYFEYLREKRQATSGLRQQQEGSYFCLESPRYRIIALDTAYDYANDGKFVDAVQREWLKDCLRRGERTNILLTQHEPFGLGERRANDLLSEVMGCVAEVQGAQIDFWFWGDEHYCAHYERGGNVPCVAACIGHGGHPVELRKVRDAMQRARPFATPNWVDLSSRFPDFRADELGNAGFCELQLRPDGVNLRYRSWVGQTLKSYSY